MGNKRQVRHQRRTEDRLIIEVTNKGKAPLDSSKWKCNWINCIGGRGLSSSGFCSEGGDWGKKNCITFKAIPLPSPSESAPQPETQAMREALQEARVELEYFQAGCDPSSTTDTVVAKIDTALKGGK